MNPLRTWFQALGTLVRSPFSLGVFAALYALLLVALYTFASTREATIWQVVITFVGLIFIPLVYFVLQSAILTRGGHHGYLAIIFKNALKLAAVTIPIVLIGYGLHLLLTKLGARYPAPELPLTLPSQAAQKPPTHWPTLLIATIRFLSFVIFLPLVTIHLWIEVSSQSLFVGGFKSFVGRIGRAIARACGPDAVLIYGIGAILFVLIPYAILFVPITVTGRKTDYALFIARLLLSFIFTLVGWTVTLTALANRSESTVPAVSSAEVQAEAPA